MLNYNCDRAEEEAAGRFEDKEAEVEGNNQLP